MTTDADQARRRILLVVHEARHDAAAIAAQFAKVLLAAGLHVSVLDTEQANLVEAGIGDVDVVPHDPGAAAGHELAVVFGGDGSILRATEICRPDDVPVLGVNLGHVGFLAEADVEDTQAVARAVVDRTYTVEERLTVEVEVRHEGRVIAQDWALNEASVEKVARGGMLEVVVEIDDRPVSRWGADGLVCATPTGSTAYNFSAGGPIVWPEVQALLLVPISAHALFARPLVVSPDSVMAIEVVGDRTTGVLWCDGRRAADLPLGSRVEVRRGATPARLARLHDRPFADRLVRKFDLPVAGWRGAAEKRDAAREGRH